MEAIQQSNDLKHKIITKDHDENNMHISITLNDECKNGHQEFAITANIYSPRGRWESEGCQHEEILKIKPELKIFVNLHLCDYLGIPMHPTANGFYHLINGFNNIKPEEDGFSAKYCEYYRVTEEQFDVLAKSKNEIQFYLALLDLKVFDQWKAEADKAIAILEEMIGKKFLVDSKKSQLHAPTEEAIKEELERQQNGYYTAEEELKRELAKQEAIIQKLQDELDKELNKHKEEYEVKKSVLLTAGSKALSNCIYYTHTRTLSFNWKSWDMISDKQYEEICSKIVLPEGVKIENKKGKS